MSKTIEMNLDPKFELDDRVRVVVSNSNFFWWTGNVTAVYRGDFELGVTHYHVQMDGLAVANSPALLFRESELAHSE